jgi:hypothetical protein
MADTITNSHHTQFVRTLQFLAADRGSTNAPSKHVASSDRDTFLFESEGERYLVECRGLVTRHTSKGGIRSFGLPLDLQAYIEMLSFMRFEGDPVFVYQQTDGDGANGLVVRLDSVTLEPKWTARIPAFNLGVALRNYSDLYVTGIGFVGRLNLTTGEYLWRHDDLYHTEGFNSFGPPRLVGDMLEIDANGERTFVVDWRTGRRVSR